MNTWSEISYIIDQYHLIAAAIAESWVSDNHDIKNLFIFNHHIFFKNTVNQQGGGIIWLFHSEVAVSKLSL